MNITNLFNLHFGIQNILVILVTALLLYKLGAGTVVKIINNWFKGAYHPGQLSSILVAGTISGL